MDPSHRLCRIETSLGTALRRRDAARRVPDHVRRGRVRARRGADARGSVRGTAPRRPRCSRRTAPHVAAYVERRSDVARSAARRPRRAPSGAASGTHSPRSRAARPDRTPTSRVRSGAGCGARGRGRLRGQSGGRRHSVSSRRRVDGGLGGYRWGVDRKRALLAREQAVDQGVAAESARSARAGMRAMWMSVRSGMPKSHGQSRSMRLV